MLEVIWHARGGQGAFTAARALGAAASLDAHKYALAFPTFGPERRGAPMRAYTKMDSAPIGDRSAVSHADIVVYLDDTLLGEGWEGEVAEGGTVLVNSKGAFADSRVIAIDANGLATEILGRPIPNTVFLGAIAAVCDVVTLEDVCEGIRQTMPAKLHGRNIEVAKAAYELTLNLTGDGPDVRIANDRSAAPPADTSFRDGHAVKSRNPASAADTATPRVISTGASDSECSGEISSQPANRIIAHLQPFTAQPADYAHSTCFQGGFLASTNAGWRSERPVIDHAACTMCLTCYMMCPDGTIYKCYAEGEGAPAAAASPTDAMVSARPTAIAIDYDFCKGCGVCAKVCPAHCISMVEEGEPEAELAASPTSASAAAQAKEVTA